MTKRASRMLAALESGPKTRNELYEHAGTFYLTNNAAAELRAAGFDVDCGLVDGEYLYGLRLDERPVGSFPPEAPGGPLVEPPTLTEGIRRLRGQASLKGGEPDEGRGGAAPSTRPMLPARTTPAPSVSVDPLVAVGEDGQLTLA